MTRIVAVANQKGGVGKTTTVVNLAASLAAADHTVLVVDLDPQANATSSFGISPDTASDSIYRALVRYAESGSSLISPCAAPMDNLDVLSGSVDSAAVEREFIEIAEPQLMVKRLLNTLMIQRETGGEPEAAVYDFIILDTPPGIGILTINALAAADTLIIPVQAEYLALEGLRLMSETLDRIRHHYNPGLQVAMVLVTMHDPRLKLSRAVEEELRTNLVEHDLFKVSRTVIPRNVRLAEAPSHGLPVILFDPSSSGATAYIALSKEVTAVETPHSRARIGLTSPPLEAVLA